MPPPATCSLCPQRALPQVAALAPRVEAMEAQWNRLRAISGAETPEDVIAYWEGECPGWCGVVVVVARGLGE